MKILRRGFQHLKENSKLHYYDFRFIFRFRDLFKLLEAFEVELVLCAKYMKYRGSKGVPKYGKCDDFRENGFQK